MTLTENTIYQNDKLRKVLVLGVHHIFETYDLDLADGRLRSRVVRYTAEWDNYGPLPSSIRTTSIDEFRTVVGVAVRTWEGVDWPANDGTWLLTTLCHRPMKVYRKFPRNKSR